jgi:Nucleotidyl transferase AbiEii toxin, Type IV TA system
VIPEPQRTYVLELFTALGATADGMVLAGGQAVRFWVARPRATRDLDFVLDVAYFREYDARIAPILERLGYSAPANARNFQFEKTIPNSTEPMRIEFLAPAEFGRKNQIRVDVQEGIHGRACIGGSIVLAETEQHEIVGALPDGTPARASVRVTRPHGLTMLKLIALDERYRNIRGAPHAEHDRGEARTHTGDVVAIMSAQRDLWQFRERFAAQFRADAELKTRTYQIIRDYFGERSAPGVILYSEALVRDRPAGDVRDLESELRRAQRLVSFLVSGV